MTTNCALRLFRQLRAFYHRNRPNLYATVEITSDFGVIRIFRFVREFDADEGDDYVKEDYFRLGWSNTRTRPSFFGGSFTSWGCIELQAEIGGKLTY